MKQVTEQDVQAFTSGKAVCRAQDIADFTNAMISESHRWIPVSERLPEKGQVVLMSNGETTICRPFRIWLTINTNSMIPPITHWKPLPPKP
jgi:N-glycosylase/DNA lyase